MRSCSALFAILLSMATAASAAETKYPKTLEHYETVRSGLAADELGSAKNAGIGLVTALQEEFAESKPMIEAAQKLAAAATLDDARAAFGLISGELTRTVQGQPGLYVMNCPMVKNGVWVQRTAKIENPYMGKKMLACGEIVTK